MEVVNAIVRPVKYAEEGSSRGASWDEPKPQSANDASSVIGTACNAWLTGQPTLAPSAAVRKVSASRPSTLATTDNLMPVPGLKSTSSVVSHVSVRTPKGACDRELSSSSEDRGNEFLRARPALRVLCREAM